MMNGTRTRTFVLSAVALALLAGCTPSEQAATPPPLAGARMGGDFALVDADGKTVRDTDFAGQYRLVYFGYASCPDVCPVDMQRLMAGFAALEKSDPAVAARVQPIFITVDPARDKGVALRQFTRAFHPRLIGLTGTPDQIAAVAKRYTVYYQADKPDAHGGYRVDHSRMTVLYGKKGEPIALIPETGTPEAIAADIRRWAL